MSKLTIIELKNQHKRKLRAECRHCGTIVEADQDSLKWESHRNESYAHEVCPNDACNHQIFFYKE